MNEHGGFDRRRFLLLAGGGVVVALVGLGADVVLRRRGEFAYPDDLNAYLRIGKDGRVTVFSGKIEMGQGVMTSLAQMLAEELGVSVGSVDMVLGDTASCPPDAGTFGSLTTRMFGPALREAGAKARAALLTLAAKRLGVARARLGVDDGVVSVVDSPSRRVTYAELAGGAKILRVVDRKVALRAANRFKVMGRSIERLDGRAKVTGEAQYAGDLRLPGMLFARLVRPPMHGAM
ncbi:MAG TPA: molybdopterin cofactor-binding domain-containing protein, partial [Steroidobacteraceae bacterium]|nr:molybdopterin cofactor-binding domain-containing protein [Steroidobacteraceae bacterium]